MDLESNLKKHINFLERHLSLLPGSRQAYDVNRMAIIFYAIESLSALNQDVGTIYKDSIEWIRKNYIVREIDNGIISGFIGSPNLDIPDTITISLPNTLFALLTLLVLDDNDFFIRIVDKKSLCNFISQCQLDENGSFVSVLDLKSGQPSSVEPHDLRFCYIAVAVLYILGCRSEDDFKKYINVDKLLSFIVDQYCESGGFGAYGEAHGGYTSCALSALSLIGRLDVLDLSKKERTIEWLLERQVSKEGCMIFQDVSNESFDVVDHGGFQGRENKYADTCYAFWCLNSLSILSSDFKNLCDTEFVKSYLLDRTQDLLIGGFKKNDEDAPDLYHSCLGIAALKLIDGEFDGVLCIPRHTSDKFNL